MTQSGSINEIYKSRNTMLSLLEIQGFNINNYNGSSINEIHTMNQTKQMDMLITNDTNKKKVYVKYHLNKNLRQNNLYEYIDDLYNLEQVLTKNDDFIIIIKDEPNEPLVKTLSNIWKQNGIYINVFNIDRLQFNVLEHMLVPPHRKLSNEEGEMIKNKYNILKDKQMPDISRFSPVAQAIGLRPGEICEIIRPSRTAITAKFYRMCT